jgi:outer membrane assembly lipoprotein YfiO
MRCARRFVCLAVGSSLLLHVAAARADDSKTWEYVGGGTWEQATTAPSQQVVSEPDLDRAEQLLYHGNHDQAKSICLAWEKTHKESPVRDRALFLIAECEFEADDRIKSFYYLDELMDECPESKLFYVALDKQYRIADDFLNGHKMRFLGMPLFEAYDEAIEMLYRIQQRSPGSPLAEKSLLRTADFYYATSQFDLAKDAYASYIRGYPRSPRIPRIKLRRAFSSLALFHGLKFDATDIIDARAELVDIQRDYPQLADEENVPAVIARIDSAFGRKILEVGAYYERVHLPKAAVYHYRYLAETYPNSAEADEARRRIATMPAWALQDPPPPAGDGYAPSTQPSQPSADSAQ